ncbi:MAG: VOC family protein [Actinomycetota bacterium]
MSTPHPGREQAESDSEFPFEQLDFLYMPSRDVAADGAYFTDILGGRIVFAIEAMGTRVSMIDLTGQPPRILLTDHLEGERPILIFSVRDLEQSLATLEGRGWERERSFEIPHGPCCSFRTPGGHRVAIYQLTRPEVGNHFDGRRDF